MVRWSSAILWIVLGIALAGCGREAAKESHAAAAPSAPQATPSAVAQPAPAKEIKLPMRLDHGIDGLLKIALSPDGQKVLTCGVKAMKLWDLPSGQMIWEVKGLPRLPMAIAFSPDGQLLALSGATQFIADGIPVEKVLRVWNVRTGQEEAPFQGRLFGGRALTFSTDSKLALSGHFDSTMRLWDVASRRELKSFRTKDNFVFAVAFSPDSLRGISGSGASLELWDLKTGAGLRTLETPRGVRQVFWLADGRHVMVASESEGVIRTWDVEQGKEVRNFKAQPGHVELSLSADGRRAITTGGEKEAQANRSLRVWDLTTGQQLLRFDDAASDEGYGHGFIAPNGKYAVCAPYGARPDSPVRVFELK